MKILRATDQPKQVLVKVYGTGKSHFKKGQEVEVSESDAELLVKSGRATYEVKEEKKAVSTKEEKATKKTK